VDNDAGLPDGVFNNLFAPISATEHILALPLVRGVALTGRSAWCSGRG
jgi:acyl-CoA reductase-like NAD-dependent aldehyde dehydrogenase